MSWALDILWWLVDYVISYVKEHPVNSVIFAVIVLRLFGTTVQTGWKGVLFSFGRATRELEPGFHMLIPFVQRVRKVPIRSITLHLPMQRITTADGLVYDVQANLVYHIVDPTTSFVQIADFRKGCEAVLPVIIQDLLGTQIHAQLQERKALDVEFTRLADAKLARWGATVEQAGFMSISPTSRTLRLTQLSQLIREREHALARYREGGLSAELAATLLGADRTVCSHAAARYRARSGKVKALRKAYVKIFLAEERERVVQEFIKLGQSREVGAVYAAADRSLIEHAEARALIASRQSATHRRHHAATAVPAPADVA